MGEAVGEVAVVGEEEKALGVPVQAAHGVEAGDLREEVKDGAPGVGVVAGGGVPLGLVEGEDQPLLGQLHPLPVHLHEVLRPHLLAEDRHLPVHPHPPLADEVLRLAAARHPGPGEEGLEAERLHGNSGGASP